LEVSVTTVLTFLVLLTFLPWSCRRTRFSPSIHEEDENDRVVKRSEEHVVSDRMTHSGEKTCVFCSGTS
ncbi:uncharacterized, partial [Tachysurus ichikawai]